MLALNNLKLEAVCKVIVMVKYNISMPHARTYIYFLFNFVSIGYMIQVAS